MNEKIIDDMGRIKELIGQINIVMPEHKQIKAILEADYKAAEWSDKNKKELIRRFNEVYNTKIEIFL